MANVDVTRIAGNIGALNALNSLTNINKQLALHQTRLSSGKRINSAADDPAGLTIATKMMARSEGMKVALDNISDASNLLSVAESGLSKMNDIMVQMRNKAEQAASDTLGSTEREAIATQLSAFANQIDNMATETKWNGVNLLTGTVDKTFQTGVDSGETTSWVQSTSFRASALAISTNVTADTGARTTGTTIAATVNNATLFTGLSKLATGSYNVNVTDTALSVAIGKVNNTSSFAGSSLLSITADAAAGAAEVSNGNHTVAITGYTAIDATTGTVAWSLDGVGQTALNISTGSGGLNGDAALQLGTTGLKLKFGSTDDFTTKAAALTAVKNNANQSATIDYIKKGMVKFNMTTASGESVLIAQTGSNAGAGVTTPTNSVAGNTTGITSYGGVGAAYDTGKGQSFTFGSSYSTGTSGFSWTNLNAYSVDVSTAAKASTYMGTVTTAMDTVNRNLASLGSLMARLDYKSEAVSTAQINVEASYNRIMNANMAEEQMNASKYTILQQTAVAMLAQANQAPQSLLSLFR